MSIVVKGPPEPDFDTKVIRDLSTRIDLINTREFSRSGIDFQKQGYYVGYPEGTAPYYNFWLEERKRCMEGHIIGGIRITGQHYFYLNYFPILKIPDSVLLSGNLKDIRVSKKLSEFPFFYYGDYEYYTELEVAEKNGKHFLVLKARGKGFSYKNAALLCRNFFHLKNSTGFAFAHEKEYLTRDGLLTKAWNGLDWINSHTGWYKSKDYKDDSMHKRASYSKKLPTGVVVEAGYKSEIIGVTLKDNPEKARGKRGELILWEEFGNFPQGLKAWDVARSSVEQTGIVTGQMIAFGTGGEEGSNFAAMEEMFYSPEAYNVQAYRNHWEGDGMGSCAYFFPNYYGVEKHTDKHGNHDVDAAIEEEEKTREIIRENATDPNALTRRKAEHPNIPSEAVLAANANIFPTDLLKSWKFELQGNNIPNKLLRHGSLEPGPDGLRFRLDLDAKPVGYPIQKDTDTTGCITILELPHKDDSGNVPSGLYYGWHDPYAFDKTSKQTSQTSMGATYIYKTTNNVTYTGDLLVAWYIGRPETQGVYHRNLFDLVQFYNAELAVENDRGKAVFAYAKHNRLLKFLAPEFKLLKNQTTGKSINRLSRGYGISMSNDLVKGQAEIYLRDWLLQPAHYDIELDRTILNLHKIYDIYLLEELIKYIRGGNFDRVSAMLVGMYQKKENFLKLEKKLDTEKQFATVDPFFTESWFQD